MSNDEWNPWTTVEFQTTDKDDPEWRQFPKEVIGIRLQTSQRGERRIIEEKRYRMVETHNL